MQLPNEHDMYEEPRSGRLIVYGIAGVSAFLLLILVIVIANNRSPSGSSDTGTVSEANPAAPMQDNSSDVGLYEDDLVSDVMEGVAEEAGSIQSDISSGDEYVDQLYRENRLTPDDLDFWDKYSVSENTGGPSDLDVLPEDPVSSPTPFPTATPDPAEDGKHTLITRSDGSTEWVLINSYLTKNTYDPVNLVLKDERMGYFEGQQEISFWGVDLSKYNGTIDFKRLKSAGVDFVMIRLGARGYGSGQILIDENFEANINGANEAGIDVGVYFFSQAITQEEAVEEASFVLQHLEGRRVVYPVAFDMEFINNDVSRIDELTPGGKTEIAEAFLKPVQAAGYQPMLYGTKEWLIEQIDLTKLQDYDIWLSQQTELPDYPYQYQMWQYSLQGAVDGIEGDADLNISFVDYAAKF